MKDLIEDRLRENDEAKWKLVIEEILRLERFYHYFYVTKSIFGHYFYRENRFPSFTGFIFILLSQKCVCPSKVKIGDIRFIFILLSQK